VLGGGTVLALVGVVPEAGPPRLGGSHVDPTIQQQPIHPAPVRGDWNQNPCNYERSCVSPKSAQSVVENVANKMIAPVVDDLCLFGPVLCVFSFGVHLLYR